MKGWNPSANFFQNRKLISPNTASSVLQSIQMESHNLYLQSYNLCLNKIVGLKMHSVMLYEYLNVFGFFTFSDLHGVLHVVPKCSKIWRETTFIVGRESAIYMLLFWMFVGPDCSNLKSCIFQQYKLVIKNRKKSFLEYYSDLCASKILIFMLV